MQFIMKFLLLIIMFTFFVACNNSTTNKSNSNFRATVENSTQDNVPVNAHLNITFSQAIDITTLTPTSLYIVNAENQSIPTVVIQSEDALHVSIVPASLFVEKSDYTLTITQELLAQDGSALSEVYYYTFTTAKKEDITPPVLIATQPTQLQAINEFTTFALQFDELLTLDNPPYLSVVDENNNSVDGEYKESGSTLRFIPSQALSVQKSYRVSLIKPLYDLFENQYSGDTEWIFRPNTSLAYNKGHVYFDKKQLYDETINSLKTIENTPYVFSKNSLFTLDSSDALIHFDANIYDAVKQHNILFIAGDEGIYSYDLESNTLIHTYKTKSPVYGIDSFKNKLYLAESDRGIEIVDINTTDASLSINHLLKIDSTAFDVVCTKKAYYVALYQHGVRKYNYSQSTPIESIITKSTARSLHLADGRLYISDGIGGITIYDIATDNSYPIATLSYVMDTATFNDKGTLYLYSVEKERGVGIYDVTDLNYIQHLSQLSSNSNLQRLTHETFNIQALSVTQDKLISLSKSGLANSYSLIPDLNSSTIISTYPLNSSLDVDTNITISLRFSKALDEATINDVTLAYQDAQAIALTQSYDSSTHTISLKPDSDLAHNQWVYVTLDATGMKDFLGNSLNFSSYEFSFKTYNPDKTPPTVTNYVPNNKGEYLSPYSNELRIKFNEAIDESTIANNINLYTSFSRIPTYSRYEATSQTIILTLLEPLYEEELGYSIQLKEAGITDLFGNGVIKTKLDFYIRAPDSSRPYVTSSVPTSSDNLFSPYTSNIYIYVSELLDESTIANNITFTSDDSIPIIFTYTYNKDKNLIEINPNSDLYEVADGYFIELLSGIKDLSGNAMQTNGLYFYISTPDTTAPYVVSATPTLSDTIIAPYSSNIYITVSEILDAETLVNNISFTVDSSAITSFSYTYDDTTNVIEINPDNDLTTPGLYEVQLLSNVTDLAGNNIITNSSLFSIQAPDTTPPSVSSTIPDNNSTIGQLGSTSTTIYFSEDILLTSVNATNIYLFDAYSYSNVPNQSLTLNGNEVVINHDTLYDTFDNYEIHVNGVKDLKGNIMTTAFVSTFKVDGTQPYILGTTPPGVYTNDQNIIGNIATIRIKINEALDPSSVTTSNIVVTSNDSPVNTQSVSFDASSNEILLTISPALTYYPIGYLLTVKNISDIYGNVLSTPRTFNFNIEP